ncbi:T9SS C-terminal target domain-containing protein [bacterium]|nr:MAG: T9SS C-terminal target domain-containing protein [bacterium]
MKKIILTVIFLLMGMGLFAQSTPEWQWVHPRPQAQYLNWFKMVDANVWYSAGDYGMFMKSTNAGVNWITKTVGYQNSAYPGAGMLQNYKCGYFLNATTGFLGVQSVPGIVKTTNGGLTFDTIRILPSGIGTVYGFSFINATTGYLAGTANYTIMKTTNGGLNWTVLPNVTSGTYKCVYAVDENNIIVGSTGGNVYFTTDAGNTWTISNVGSTLEINSMKFTNALTGYICGWNGLVRYTTNGGTNWTGTSPSSSSLFSIAVEGSTVYVSGYVSTQAVYKSTDNGNNWSSISYAGSPSITGFNAYSFDKNGSNMMCVGTYGEMIKSTNNGVNWTSLNYRKSLANLSGDLYAQSNNGRIIACGVNLDNPDAILSSPDGGITWTIPNFNISSYCSSISMVNPSTGYLCGRWGLFFKTTDGGTTWDTSLTNQTMFANYFCSGIDFINVNTGWMVGGDPNIGGNTKIWKTTNGGVNWTEQVSAFSGPVGFKIDMVNANTGYMTHRYGLQKTTNGGTNWTMVTQPSLNPNVGYLPVKAVDSVHVFTTGSNCQVYASQNGGATWDSLNFPVYAGGFFSADWYDNQNGCAGATIGVVGRTTNRGQTWQVTNCGGYAIYSIKMVHPDTIFVINGNQFGAMIMKYSRGLATGGFTYENKVPSQYILKQNYPNPFNPTTTIEFDLPKAGNVTLKIFDITGREVAREISGLSLRAGNYKVNFNGSMLSSGVYFYSLVLDGKIIDTKKMLLVK